MCCCVASEEDSDITKDYNAFIFRVRQSKKHRLLGPEEKGTKFH